MLHIQIDMFCKTRLLGVYGPGILFLRVTVTVSTRTAIFKDTLFTQHDPGFDHIENPQRVETLYRELEKIIVDQSVVEPQIFPADKNTVALNHTENLIDKVEATSGKIYSVLGEDTFTSPESYNAACLAAGAVKTGIELLYQDKIDNGFALVRPPGHHAERDNCMGFCLFNNIAVAAKYGLKELGINKILILDWDVHHGNGTQEAFYGTDQVLYISLHQFPFYPGTGSLEETGEGEGEGYTINIPLPGGQGDLEYANIFNTVIKPICSQYNPDLILVSAGFDGHCQDAISSMRLTHQGYSYMTRVLMEAAEQCCNGKILFTLEGGYDQTGVKEGVFAVLNELCGEVIENVYSHGLSEQNLDVLKKENGPHPAIEGVKAVVQRYWNL